MFWFKQKEIHVDCFISSEIIYKNFKIETANKFTPKEWREHPSHIQQKANDNPNSKLMINTPTWKKCRGIVDLFTVGFILPNWADCQVEMFDDGKFNISNHHIPNAAISVGYHDRNQYGNTVFKDYGHLKFESPWFLREKTGVQFIWNPCIYHDTNQNDIIQILSGVMDYKYQMSTNINMFIKKGSIAKFYAGEPLVHIVPISEKKVKLHHHLLSEEEYQKVISLDVNAGMYVNTRKVKSPTESKCPFGFGE